jgi:hypothetical protein
VNTSSWFDDLPVIGKLSPEEAVLVLREVGEFDTADRLEMQQEATSQTFGSLRTSKNFWFLQDKPWQHTAHAFGYLATLPSGGDTWPIHPVDTIVAHPHLKQAHIKITLNRLQVASYPGGGTHCVLLHFNAQNQVPNKIEQVHFQATYRVREGERAGVQGYPIFVGLKVGNEGLIFRCRTINVKNERDEAFLGFLASDTFKSGLKLMATAQPAITPFSEMALALTREIAKRHRNVSVQDFDLGLDFGTNPMGARLAEGSYLAVQIPESLQPMWNWNEWLYQPAIGQIIKCTDGTMLPYNYLVFTISLYDGA